MNPAASNAVRTVRVNAKIRRPRPRSADARRLAAVFGLDGGLDETLYDDFEMLLGAGQIIAVVGPSGAGKSVLLRRLIEQTPDGLWLDAAGLGESELPAISALDGSTEAAGPAPLARRMALLARCGLAEPAALITPAKDLSAGQLYRLALARALWLTQDRTPATGPTVIAADEFAASLDWPTGSVLCRRVHR